MNTTTKDLPTQRPSQCVSALNPPTILALNPHHMESTSYTSLNSSNKDDPLLAPSSSIPTASLVAPADFLNLAGGSPAYKCVEGLLTSRLASKPLLRTDRKHLLYQHPSKLSQLRKN